MARNGDTQIDFNENWFEDILRRPEVEALADEAAARVLSAAVSSAPVDTGTYQSSLHIEHRNSQRRRATRVVSDDPKALLIEAKTGNLARALKAAKSS